MRGPEARLQDWFIKKYKSITWLYKTSDRYTAGIPDVLGCYKGQMFAIEFKSPEGIVKGIQTYTMDQMAKAGCKILVARTKKECEEFICSLLSK